VAKVRAGACGICGAAAVKPTAEAVNNPAAWKHSKGGAPLAQKWIDGHLYENTADGQPHRLKRVRCRQHAEDDDPRSAAADSRRRHGEGWYL
jgi:hypothetical protein